jgi:hypothetical protein
MFEKLKDQVDLNKHFNVNSLFEFLEKCGIKSLGK